MWLVSQDRKYLVAAKVLRLDGPLYNDKGEATYRIVAIPEAGIEIAVAQFGDKEAAVKEFDNIIAEITAEKFSYMFGRTRSSPFRS